MTLFNSNMPSFRLGSQTLLGIGLITFASALSAQEADPIEFVKQVKPILESTCVSCHGAEKSKGGVELHTKSAAIGDTIIEGSAADSSSYTTTILSADDDDRMPPTGPMLTKEQTEVLRLWIDQGAKWPDGVVLEQTRRIPFTEDVKPILEQNCLSCHQESKDKGGLRLDNKASAFAGGDSGDAIVPGFPEDSPLYTLTILPEGHDDIMPPKGDPLTQEQTDTLKAWIEQGAAWPDDETLQVAKKPELDIASAVKLSGYLISDIYDIVVDKTAEGMEPYKVRIPDSRVDFEMLPIPGGEFVMGSPESEAKRKDDEGPQLKVKVDPFWMGKYEVTWDEYELFMYPDPRVRRGRKNGSLVLVGEPENTVDALARPTPPYVDMSFGMGRYGYPAISMTQHAALMYCKWLTAKTGVFYRLPTEAEWEYACRAGTTTAYHFGEDPADLEDYAWYYDNSDGQYQKIGLKKPNPWGLYDMHGNVMEWTLDQYASDSYSALAQFEGTLRNPWVKPVTLYPRVAKGGSWDDDPEGLRSAARVGSRPNWKQQDPQLPKSIWYLTDAQWLGFRLVRPARTPSPEEMEAYWTTGAYTE
jgi:formylglycine-generating enzyme required for sulfatase activity/mono/diheme cytochrome c family protein